MSDDIRPQFVNGIGYCADDCPQHDGKRCRLLGHRPDGICEPWVSQLVTLQPMRPRPTIVCLCGSTRFRRAFEQANRSETLAGRIVLSVGMFGHDEGIDMNGPVKAALDELHLAKIDLADEVLVLNATGGKCSRCDRFCTCAWCPDCNCEVTVGPYIGESTRREIAYAETKGKPVRYLEAP